MVGVSGFEPEASWTRTKRDTKLRHTPIPRSIIVKIPYIVKSRVYIFAGCMDDDCLSYTAIGGECNELLCRV